MANITNTHIGDFTQGLSDPISLLEELKACSRALMECTEQALRGSYYEAGDGKELREFSLMIKEKGLPQKHPLPFLTLS